MARDRTPNESDTRILRILISTTVISKLGDHGFTLVVPLAVLATTGSVASAVLTIAFRGVSYAMSPFIGSLIDRVDRRTVFVLSQFQQALCVAVAATFLDNQLVVSTSLLLSGFGGVAASLTSQFVLIPELVSKGNRPKAVAKLVSANEFAKVGGILAGGAALTVIAPTPAALCVTLFYIIAGSISLMLPSVPVKAEKSNVWSDIQMGLSWLRKPDIGWLVASMATSNLALGGIDAVLVTVLGKDGIEPVFISVVVGVGILGGAIGARLAPHTFPSSSLQSRILIFQVAAGISFALIAIGSSVWIVASCFAAMSLTLGLSNVISITFRQETIPIELSGRVNSVIRMFIAGANPLSGMIYAWAASQGYWIWWPALLLELVALAIWASFVVATRKRGLKLSVLFPACPTTDRPVFVFFSPGA